MLRHIKRFFHHLVDGIWSLFLNGLITLLPIVLTFGIFALTLKVLRSWLQPIKEWQPVLADRVPYLATIFSYVPFAEIILAILIIILVGTILKLFVLHSLINAIEGILFRVPLIRTVYAGIKQLVNALNPANEMSFQKVVLIEFPRKGIYSLGFMTNQLQSDLAPNDGTNHFCVYVPTTPNPTSGFVVIVSDDQIIPTELTRQEAMALIISGGIIQPERFARQWEEGGFE